MAQRAPRHPRLAGLCRADVAIVGGGITGAIAALRFAEAGVDAVVLEADRIGHGSTAASSALLLQEPDARLSALSERYGTATARRIWRLSHDAAHDLIALIERLSTPAAIARRDTVYFTTDADEVAPLHREYVARCRAGFEATWLTPRALRVEVGIPARAGIRTRGSAHCDPFRACEGVMREAVRAGARVFERSPARRIESRRGGVRVRTDGGVVEARQVVIATGYATRQFRPLAGRFQMSRTYVAATPPLDARARREIGLADVLLWDTRRQYHYARWTADHRLLLGGADRPIRGGPGPAARLSTAVAEIRAHFEAAAPGARRRRDRARLGGALREHAGQPALRRPAPPVSGPRLRARLRRQRHDVRLARRPPAGRAVARRRVEGPRPIYFRSLTATTPEWFTNHSGVVH